MSAWETFKRYWNLNDDDCPITDASSCEDSIVEDMMLRYQGVSKEVTDRLAELSAAKSAETEALRLYRESVILAYSAALNGNLNEAKKALEKVVNT